jgi:hypothetical protein
MAHYHPLLGKYHFTAHAINQYDGRVTAKRGDIIKSIKHDLRIMNIKNIVRKEHDVYVFTKGYKEFIFAKGKDGLYLKTTIKRNYEDTKVTLYKRKRDLVTI